MNKLQEQSLQAKDARYVTDIIDEGFAEDSANHKKTHEMLSQILHKDIPKELPRTLTLGGVVLSDEYYNLFVIGGENFNSGSFTVAKDRALVIGIEPDVKSLFFNLRDDSVVERILSLPSLFMSENIDFMRSRPGQKAFIGRVTDITIEPNDIRISFETDTQIFQQSITDISHSLGIVGNPGCSELNNTHWTIKRVDLMKVLTETGLVTLPANQTQHKQQEQQYDKYRFIFTIDIDGNIEPFSIATSSAIREWFEEKASDVISEMRDDNLRDTFSVEINDMRMSIHNEIDAHIHKKLASNMELSEHEEYLKWGVRRVLKRDNAFIKSALEMLLSNRVIKGVLGITHYTQLENILKKIIEFRYGDLDYKLPNNRELISLDIYINANRRNDKHECFVAYVKKSDIEKLFGGTREFDLYDRSVMELSNCREDVIVQYAFFLAELDLSGFDFSTDNRMLNFLNFRIGLH